MKLGPDVVVMPPPSPEAAPLDATGWMDNMVTTFTKGLQRGSSEVIWCEGEVRMYAETTAIAEFYNTISNFMFFVFPPIFFYIWRPYSRHVNAGCNVVWILLMVVGAGSFYFHATLSLVGQLVDELAILWVLLVGIATWVHLDKVFSCIQLPRPYFQLFCYVFATLSSFLNSTFPVINRVFLFSLGAPIIIVLLIQVRRSSNIRIHQLTIKSIVIYSIAVISWLNDRFLCQFWGSVAHFPYLHSLWHVLVFVSCYYTCVIFAYFDAIYVAESLRPDVMYWPNDEWQSLGIPYIGLRRPPPLSSSESLPGAAFFSPAPPGDVASVTLTASCAPGVNGVNGVNGVAGISGVTVTQEFRRLDLSTSSASFPGDKPPPREGRPISLTREPGQGDAIHSHSY